MSGKGTVMNEELVVRFFAALEDGDITALREIYAPDAVIWHNDDLADPADLHRIEARRPDQPLDFLASPVVIGRVEQDRRFRRPVTGGLEETGRHGAERHGQARPRRQPSGYHLSGGLPFRQDP
jgi:ketosteroid isomerase-like protein